MVVNVQTLLSRAGCTYAEQAGIRLADKPSPLYQLLVLAVLLSTRINSDLAVAAARELFAVGCRTPSGMLAASWQDRVDALGRAHYVRYDESTATALGQGAELIQDQYRGDLRRLRQQADGDVAELERRLRQVPRLGPTGAAIFCREAQAVWPELRPYLDQRTVAGAGQVGLPTDPTQLARHVRPEELARLAAALVRVSRDRKLAEQLSADGHHQ
jgi:hypothetical protein